MHLPPIDMNYVTNAGPHSAPSSIDLSSATPTPLNQQSQNTIIVAHLVRIIQQLSSSPNPMDLNALISAIPKLISNAPPSPRTGYSLYLNTVGISMLQQGFQYLHRLPVVGLDPEMIVLRDYILDRVNFNHFSGTLNVYDQASSDVTEGSNTSLIFNNGGFRNYSSGASSTAVGTVDQACRFCLYCCVACFMQIANSREMTLDFLVKAQIELSKILMAPSYYSALGLALLSLLFIGEGELAKALMYANMAYNHTRSIGRPNTQIVRVVLKLLVLMEPRKEVRQQYVKHLKEIGLEHIEMLTTGDEDLYLTQELRGLIGQFTRLSLEYEIRNLFLDDLAEDLSLLSISSSSAYTPRSINNIMQQVAPVPSQQPLMPVDLHHPLPQPSIPQSAIYRSPPMSLEVAQQLLDMMQRMEILVCQLSNSTSRAICLIIGYVATIDILTRMGHRRKCLPFADRVTDLLLACPGLFAQGFFSYFNARVATEVHCDFWRERA